jgi:hypothetical protein
MRTLKQESSPYSYEVHVIPLVEKEIRDGGNRTIKTYEEFHKRNTVLKFTSEEDLRGYCESKENPKSRKGRIIGYAFRNT